MQRRAFVAGMAAVMVAPLAADAQQARKVPRIGFLSAIALSASPGVEGFRRGLRELGYVEGQNITVDYRSAEGGPDRLAALAADLVRQEVDVIVTGGQPAPDAARKATQSIPIVVAVMGDAVNDGLVASLDRPGGNLTGLTSIAPELVGKQLELLKEVVPGLSRVAVLHDPNHSGHPVNVRHAEMAARALRLRLTIIDAGSAAALDDAFHRMTAERVSGALVLRGGLFMAHRVYIANLAARAKLAVMYGHREETEAGGLMSYGTDVPELYRRAAMYVDKILKGAKPADLPVEQPTKFEFVFNLKTARALDLTIPPSLLLRADQVIE
jgi:putative ABC transport system substrate-binding protein